MIRSVAVCLLAGFCAASGFAQDNATTAYQWLQRISTAAQTLSYTGIFVYQNGSHGETSRITHIVDQDIELERLEVLDGSPREIVRRNDEIRCFLPENQLLIVARRSRGRSFPAMLPRTLGGLAESYQVRLGPVGRVAGIDSQAILIEPKDDSRYGRVLWFDPVSGLLLKEGLIGARGEVLEMVAFTEIRIGGKIDPRATKSRFEEQARNWQVFNVQSSSLHGEEGQWNFRTMLPGFRRLSWMKQQLRPDAPEVMQAVFSDGLAAISVFIEPANAQDKAPDSAFAMGAISVQKRRLGNQQLLVMGDVPAAALKRFADGIELRGK